MYKVKKLLSFLTVFFSISAYTNPYSRLVDFCLRSKDIGLVRARLNVLSLHDIKKKHEATLQNEDNKERANTLKPGEEFPQITKLLEQNHLSVNSKKTAFAFSDQFVSRDLSRMIDLHIQLKLQEKENLETPLHEHRSPLLKGLFYYNGTDSNIEVSALHSNVNIEPHAQIERWLNHTNILKRKKLFGADFIRIRTTIEYTPEQNRFEIVLNDFASNGQNNPSRFVNTVNSAKNDILIHAWAFQETFQKNKYLKQQRENSETPKVSIKLLFDREVIEALEAETGLNLHVKVSLFELAKALDSSFQIQ